ncbi:MAG: alpha/beta fold hydrolase [Alphaproteobacteria bacterium]|nr:alpha/beta fold hydrolase [Alphaproteobacteria bacterium]
MATFVLIHGAWHGAWCWERVTPLLERAGHRAVALDLPGMGNDRTPLANVTLASWTEFVSEEIEKAPDPVVLVGHSRGGIVISEVAERIPDRIQALVYLAAFLVPSGKTLADMLALVPPKPVAENVIAMSADGLSSTIVSGKVAPVFYNTTAADLQARAESLLTPEPMMSFASVVETSETRFGRVPRAYIECLQDNALPIELQRVMRQTLPCDLVITLDTDHSPFYSAPQMLCDALLKTGNKSKT